MADIIRRSRGLIIDSKRALLMQRVKDGMEYYTLCGGKLEENEAPEDGCLREIYEETALRVTIEKMLFQTSDTYQNIINQHFVFLCRYHGGEPRLNGEEILRNTSDNQYNPIWVALDNIQNLPIKPDIIATELITHLHKNGLIQ